jgi:hypothetical protein
MIQRHVFSINLVSSQHIILKVNQAEEGQRDMSQQAGAGQGAGRSGRCRLRYILKGRRIDLTAETKPYKTAIAEIAHDTFKMGHNKFAAQFTQS